MQEDFDQIYQNCFDPVYLEDAQSRCVEPFPVITATLDRDWSSPALNVAGRKMACCQ